MRTKISAAVIIGAGVLGLSACGGSVELDQAQTAESLLTAEEFPLDGFTRGEVEQSSGEEDAEDDGSLADLVEGQDVPEKCLAALEATDFDDSSFAAQSDVEFTGGDESAMLPVAVDIIVATMDGDSPLTALANVSTECDTLTMDDDGVSMTMTFSELADLEGTKMSIKVADIDLEAIVGGESSDKMLVAAFSTGVPEADVVKVIEAQMKKVEDAG